MTSTVTRSARFGESTTVGMVHSAGARRHVSLDRPVPGSAGR